MSNTLIGIILFLIFLALDLYLDYRKWKKDKTINHFKEWVIRCILMTPSLLLMIPSFSLLDIIITTLMLGAWWWEFFDGIYNKLRGFKWRFNGGITKNSSKLDLFLHKIGDTPETILKWGLIISFTISYIL